MGGLTGEWSAGNGPRFSVATGTFVEDLQRSADKLMAGHVADSSHFLCLYYCFSVPSVYRLSWSRNEPCLFTFFA